MNRKFARTKIACYTSNITGMAIGNLPPLLFVTFRDLYGISYSFLGMLVLVNFFTQLLADLIFSFFSHKFNIRLTLRLMPVITMLGLILYALSPVLFGANLYIGLVLGTIVFSFAMGLGEVLLSPVIAAIPADNPEREMSKLHSIYAWGVIFVVAISTLFLTMIGGAYWQILVVMFAFIQIVPAVLFAISPIPEMKKDGCAGEVSALFKQKALWLCILSIFFGGAAECTMSQWSSSYLELALGIPKALGDIFGVALFAFALGLGRTLYAQHGKNITKTLFLGSIGSTICYTVAFFSQAPLVGLIACALTGLCVSMLWPGSLVAVAEKIPTGGVVMYAMMAAGGDIGASLAPQLAGMVADAAGIRYGLLVGIFFSLFGVGVNYILLKQALRNSTLPIRRSNTMEENK